VPTTPALPCSAGTIKPGYSKLADGATLDVVSAFQSFGGFTAGLINEEQRSDIVRNSCPGPGACFFLAATASCELMFAMDGQ
jgi:dihydroxy-acid dehydratase